MISVGLILELEGDRSGRQSLVSGISESVVGQEYTFPFVCLTVERVNDNAMAIQFRLQKWRSE